MYQIGGSGILPNSSISIFYRYGQGDRRGQGFLVVVHFAARPSSREGPRKSRWPPSRRIFLRPFFLYFIRVIRVNSWARKRNVKCPRIGTNDTNGGTLSPGVVVLRTRIDLRHPALVDLSGAPQRRVHPIPPESIWWLAGATPAAGYCSVPPHLGQRTDFD